MSARVTGMVFDRYPNGGGEMLLALALADHAHDDGTHIFPSIARLADQAWDVDKRAAVPEPRWDDNGVGTVDVADIPWWPGEVDAIRLQFGAAQTVSSYFMTDWVAIGRPTPGAGVALVQEEARARVAADVAEASKRETLAVQLRGDYEGSDLSQVPSGLFAAERDARVTADEANASAIEVIQARMPTGDGTVATEASVTEERQARADGDSANAEAIGRVSARMPAGDGKVASAEALDAVSTRVEETEEGVRAVGDRTSSLEAQVTYKHAGDRDWNAGDRDVRAGVKTWQSVIAQGDRAVAKQVESVRAELGDFEATATRSIEVIATEQGAQAAQIQHLGVELDGKASSDYVEEISARVNVTEQGIEAFTGQLASVKAEVDGKASAQVVQGMEARVVQNENGLTQVLARAFLNVIANSGGGPLIGGMVIENNGQVINTRFSSNTFEVISPGASEGMEWRGGFLRVWKGSAQRIIGTNFGSAGDNLVDYFGPNVGAGAASKANAVMWMDANGSAYFGGQLSAGILRNAVQTTTTQTVGVELVNGPFATNGRVRSVTVSFSRRHIRTKTTYGSDGFVAGAGQNTARVEIYRRVGEGAESLWQVLNVSGSVMILNEQDGPDSATSTWGGSFTVNDTSTSAQTMTYRGVITSFTEQDVRHESGSFQQQSITQSLSIISVEN
ncbi:hypothetical protein I5T99_12670 [Stenotrophomonas maltophilia]|nr:hypothetical protein [Stenotrophomonas maltophilia]